MKHEKRLESEEKCPGSPTHDTKIGLNVKRGLEIAIVGGAPDGIRASQCVKRVVSGAKPANLGARL